jgi:uncharacterized membrane protein
MPPAFLSRAPDLVRLPIVVNVRAISLSEGMRAGLSVAVIIALNEYREFPALREAALAALLTCICDPGGPIRRRIPVLLGFALTGAAVTTGYGLLRAFGPAVALPIGVFGLFCSSFARIYGQAPQQLGALLATVQILSLDRAITSTAEAGILATAFIGGSLWAILLTMVIWRIYPFLPARRAVAEAYRQASQLVRDLHTLVQAPSITDAAWEAHARIHRRATRDAIEAARTAIMDTVRARGAASNRAAQAIIRLETADQIFGGLIALSDLLEHSRPAERRIAERLSAACAPSSWLSAEWWSPMTPMSIAVSTAPSTGSSPTRNASRPIPRYDRSSTSSPSGSVSLTRWQCRRISHRASMRWDGDLPCGRGSCVPCAPT